MQILALPSGLRTVTIGEAQGLSDSLMNPCFSSDSISLSTLFLSATGVLYGRFVLLHVNTKLHLVTKPRNLCQR